MSERYEYPLQRWYEENMRPAVYGERVPHLTPREAEVMDLRNQKLRIRAIAEKLGISPKTVEQHLAHARQKMRRGIPE